MEGGATCVATQGKFVVSAGRDQTIRLFNRTQEVRHLDCIKLFQDCNLQHCY